jgi:hypothetical protein
MHAAIYADFRERDFDYASFRPLRDAQGFIVERTGQQIVCKELKGGAHAIC